jgi:acetyltransferase-like isoleucine patch superfamily enzyme
MTASGGCPLSAPPAGVECDGQGFADDCLLEAGAVALAALAAGTLRVRIWRHGRQPVVAGTRLRIDAAAGNISIGIGGDDCSVEFATRSSGAYDLRLWRRSHVAIGARTTSNGTRVVCDDSEFACGADCMFSDAVLVQSADQHGIVDVSTRQIINGGRSAIEVGEHVWLGRGATLMPGVRIGPGSVIGTGAVVTRDVEAMSIAAGVPARAIRSGFTWCRDPETVDSGVERFIDRWLASQ